MRGANLLLSKLLKVIYSKKSKKFIEKNKKDGLKFFKGQFARACDEGYIDDNDRTFINASLENIENVLHNNNKTSDELKEALNLSNKIKSRIERYSVDE